jgi:hypothetical protein
MRRKKTAWVYVSPQQLKAEAKRKAPKKRRPKPVNPVEALARAWGTK